ncbi:MAG: carboxypeptidase-like regulatory domain-containing protein, partial [Anaerolineae bacterium]
MEPLQRWLGNARWLAACCAVTASLVALPPLPAHAVERRDGGGRSAPRHAAAAAREASALPRREDGPTVTISVSGTVTGPGGAPVEDVHINVGSNQDWYETETDANGFYSATIKTDGFMWFDVLPKLETRLVQFGLWKERVTESFTQDFSLTSGHLMRLELIGDSGEPLTDGSTWLHVERLLATPPPGTYYILPWNAEDQVYQSVWPPDIYYLQTHNEPEGYHATTAPFDLRPGDLITEMVVNTSYVHPVPYDPPDASKISFGSPNSLGEVDVTGAPGAVLPLAHVLLGNVNSTHQAHVISEGDGSFSAKLYAPPGSAVLIRHGPASEVWRYVDRHGENLQRFPGTIINRPHTHTSEAGSLPFAAVGGIGIVEAAGDPPTRGSVGAAWAMTGSIGPFVARAGVGTGGHNADPG